MLHRGQLNYDDPRGICPVCNMKATRAGVVWSTLVGYPPGRDDNHYYQEFECKPCDLVWTHNWKIYSRKAWLTSVSKTDKRNYLIKGENGCFEQCIDPRVETT